MLYASPPSVAASPGRFSSPPACVRVASSAMSSLLLRPCRITPKVTPDATGGRWWSTNPGCLGAGPDGSGTGLGRRQPTTSKPLCRSGDPLVRGGQCDPDVTCATLAVERAGSDQDAGPRQAVDAHQGRLVGGRPQVQTGLGVLDREPRRSQRRGEQVTPVPVALLLLGDVRVVV